MAHRVQVLLADDLHGGKADEKVTFALDGKSYEIDLTDANAQTLRENLAEFVKAGRRTRGRSVGRTASTAGSADTAKIRAWAIQHGHDIYKNGQMPVEVREASGYANG
ncbi:Lsr2 family protein [Streptomyces sp. NPDC101151]|uniref:histone-like nucleoid-structuring protein Lsr2 n=1 Tax=Streptomyces sp. NPDC101151 TaxID=3366115 RepID=UPI0037FA0D8B